MVTFAARSCFSWYGDILLLITNGPVEWCNSESPSGRFTKRCYFFFAQGIHLNRGRIRIRRARRSRPES
jgi:hypothetical protein